VDFRNPNKRAALEIERIRGGGRRRYRSEGHCCCRQEAQNCTGNTVERTERAGRGVAELAADQVKSEPYYYQRSSCSRRAPGRSLLTLIARTNINSFLCRESEFRGGEARFDRSLLPLDGDLIARDSHCEANG